MNGASAQGALKDAHDIGLPVGLHVNLTEGSPISPLDGVKSLLAPPELKYFRGKMGFRDALAAGQVDMQEVAAEIRAQLNRFITLNPNGEPPTHFDGHQHIQTLPGIREVMAEVFQSTVQATRIPTPHSAAEDFSGMPQDRADFYASIGRQCAEARGVYARHGIHAPGVFLGYTTMGSDCSVQRILKALQAVIATPGADGDKKQQLTIEWMVHPGSVTRPRPLFAADVAAGFSGDAGCGDGPDGFSLAMGREVEMAALKDPALREGIAALGLELISYAGLNA